MASFLEELRQNSVETTVEIPEKQEPAEILMVDNAESESFSKRDLERGEGGADEIFETIKSKFPELTKKTFLELIDDLIKKRWLAIVEVESFGKGAPKNVIKVR
jgi:hypothetical protein